MRAALFVGEPELSVEDVTAVAPGPRDVVVRIGASGVCHSDVSASNGSLPLPPPCILGHEGAGVIDWVGSEVSRVKVGDKVIASFVPSCGSCFFCLHGQSNLCELLGEIGFLPRVTRADGSTANGFAALGTFSDQMTTHEASVVRVDTELPDEQLALIGCGVTTGVGAALNTARVEPGSTVAVIGCGGVGQAVIQGARIAGASRIIAVDPVELKRKAAVKLGATDTVDPADGDPVAQVHALTSGRGADYAFEVIGLPETIAQAYATARRGGAVVVVGMPRLDSQVTLGGFGLFYEEKRILGCVYGSSQVRRDFPRFIDLVETGRLDIADMVTRTIGLDDVNEAFRAMQAGEVIRSVITHS
jgi:S-(hydroxymethyl)glutathione dehydrogenase / alcohol dehydrogenase